MRTLLSTISCLFFCVFLLKAQNASDCRIAIPVCADQSVMGTVNGSGDIDDFDPDSIRQTGCLEKGSVISANIENNTAWYIFRAGTDGEIGFNIEALPVNAGAAITAEFDFALYGPFDQASGANFCEEIGSGLAQPIRCNYEVNDTAFTGLGVNPISGQAGGPNVVGSQNTYDEFLEVKAGEVYFLLINNFNTNFNGDPESFMLTFTGESVNEDQNTALDCSLRDEFLGFDKVACEGDPEILLSALNSPVGNDIASVAWSVDRDGDGAIDAVLAGTGPSGATLVVPSGDSGRYFATITTSSGTPPQVTDAGGVLVSYFGVPVLEEVVIREDLQSADDPEQYHIEIVVDGEGVYEYALNGGDYQDSPVFLDVPPGLNTVVINDKNGCGLSDPQEFVVVGYPKFFTPNGDDYNATWEVKGMDRLIDPVVFVFDRYGKLLKQLSTTDFSWDGTFNGREMPASDYWFRLEYNTGQQGNVVAKTVRNHFSLIR